MKKYGVVLIGCGHIGESHIEDIYYRENIDIVSVVDTDVQKAKLFAKKYNSKFYDTDYQEYIKRDDVDIVIIATYVDTHLKILSDCLKYNKHVICEKPIVSNQKDGLRFKQLVEESKSVVLISHILRYNESYIKIKELIDSGLIGDIKVMRMAQNHHTICWERYKRLLEDCSPVLDCGVHYFDVMQWFTGAKIEHVSGYGTTIDSDLSDSNFNYGIVTLKLSNGAIGYYEVGWSNNIQSENKKEFIGTKGRISLHLREQRFFNKEEGDLIEIYLAQTNEYKSINIDCKYKPMYEQLTHLIDIIEARESYDNHFNNIYSAFEVGLAADKAIRENMV